MALKETIEKIREVESDKLGKDLTTKSYSFFKKNYVNISDYMLDEIIENYENYFLKIYQNEFNRNNLNGVGNFSYFKLSLKEYNFLFSLCNFEKEINHNMNLSKIDYKYSLISSKILNLYDIINKEDKSINLIGNLVKSINNNFYINDINGIDNRDSLKDILGYTYGIKNGISLVNKISSDSKSKEEFIDFYKDLKELGHSFSFRNNRINKEYYNKDSLEKIISKKEYKNLNEILRKKKFYQVTLLDKELQENIYKLIN